MDKKENYLTLTDRSGKISKHVYTTSEYFTENNGNLNMLSSEQTKNKYGFLDFAGCLKQICYEYKIAKTKLSKELGYHGSYISKLCERQTGFTDEKANEIAHHLKMTMMEFISFQIIKLK